MGKVCFPLNRISQKVLNLSNENPFKKGKGAMREKHGVVPHRASQ